MFNQSINEKISFIVNFAILNIKTRYKSTRLGLLWTALEPLLYFVVLYVVFNSIRDRGEDFAIYLISGLILFHIFTRGTSGGLISLTNNSGIMKSIKVNKIFFPTVSTVATIILATVDVSVFFLLMPVFQFTPSWTIILLPIPFILLFLLIQGLSYLLSVITVKIKDIQYVWIIFTHSLIFVSPIFWKISEVKEGPLLLIHRINPLGQLIEITHQIVLYNTIPPIYDWMYTTAIVLGIFFTGFVIFQKLKNTIMEDL